MTAFCVKAEMHAAEAIGRAGFTARKQACSLALRDDLAGDFVAWKSCMDAAGDPHPGEVIDQTCFFWLLTKSHLETDPVAAGRRMADCFAKEDR